MLLNIVEKTVEPGITVLELTGRLALGRESQRIESLVEELAKKGSAKVVLDLTGVEYIDSAGIGMLVACNGQMDRVGGRMRVAGAQGTVAKSFEVVHMDRITSLDGDVDAALRNLSAGSAGA